MEDNLLATPTGVEWSPEEKFEFYRRNKDGAETGVIDSVIAEYIKDRYSIFVMDQKFYVYVNGYYRLDEDGTIVKTLIKNVLNRPFRNVKTINPIYNLLLSDFELSMKEERVNAYKCTWINFKNGMLDAETLELHKHSETYLSMNQVPWIWNGIDEEKINNSIIREFLLSMFKVSESFGTNKDVYEMFTEYAGYCMTTDTRLQKFLIINGEGGTGKSVLLDMIRNLVGSCNCSSIRLQDFSTRFDTAFLRCKLANIYSDLPSKAMEMVDGLKMVTGEDVCRAEWKGGKVFQFKPYAKLVFSANKIPKTMDEATGAYYRRLLIIKIMERCKHFDNLKERINEDMESFVMIAVKALNNMYQKGSITESVQSIKGVETLYKETDTVHSWLCECGYEKVQCGKGFRINRTDLYNEYNKYCIDHDRKPCQQTGFYTNLREKGFDPDCRTSKERFVDGIRRIEIPEMIDEYELN